MDGAGEALHSFIHSGLFQVARASRKTFNLKGRNLRFEYTAKTGMCGEAHFGNSRMSSARFAQDAEHNCPVSRVLKAEITLDAKLV